MSLHRQIARLRSRYRAAQDFYRKNQSWARNVAWEILDEIAQTTPGNYAKYKDGITVAVEDGNMYEAFKLLGAAAKRAIEDLEYAQRENYDVAYMDMFEDFTEQSTKDHWS